MRKATQARGSANIRKVNESYAYCLQPAYDFKWLVKVCFITWQWLCKDYYDWERESLLLVLLLHAWLNYKVELLLFGRLGYQTTPTAEGKQANTS